MIHSAFITILSSSDNLSLSRLALLSLFCAYLVYGDVVSSVIFDSLLFPSYAQSMYSSALVQ